MRDITVELLNALKEPVKQRESVSLTSTLSTFSKEIKSCELITDGRLNMSNMTQLKVTLHGKHDLQGTYFDFKRDFTTLGGNTYTINYGAYRVIKQDYSDDTKTTDLDLYDSMVSSHVEYKKEDINITFPISLLNLFKAVARVMDVTTSVTQFNLSNEMVSVDEWSNTVYTYRDVLDHIAQVSSNSIYIKNNKLHIGAGQETGVIINYQRSKDMMIDEKVGKFNILNLTREPQHDNYPYPSNWYDIPIDDRREYAIVNNPIIDRRREYFAPKIFNNVKNIEYYPFQSDTFGWGIFEIGDIVTVVDLDGVSYKSIITSEFNSYNGMWVTTLGSEKTKNAQDRYVIATDSRREGMRVYFLVDQQNGVIQGVVEELGELKDLNAQLTIRVDEIDLLVQNTNNGNVIGNINPIDYMGWTGGSILLATSDLLAKYGLTGAMNFIPKQMEQSLSEYGASFTNNGSATSPFGYVVPTEKYSYKAKIQRFKPFTIDLLEFKDMVSAHHKSTRYSFLAPQAYVQFTSTLDNQTQFVRLKFNISGVTPSDRLEITEMMFNRGLPKEYYISGAEAVIYAQTNFKLTDDKISAVVDEVKIVNDKTELNKAELVILSNEIDASVESIRVVDGKTESNKANIGIQSDRIDANVESIAVVDGKTETNTANISAIGGKVEVNTQSIEGINGDIHNAGLDISALEGIEVYGKKFEIQNEARNKVIFGVNTVEGQEQVNILGSIQSEGGVIAFDSVNREIRVGGVGLVNTDDVGVLGLKGAGIRIGEGYQSSTTLRVIQWDVNGTLYPFATRFTSGATILTVDQLTPRVPGLDIGASDRRYRDIFLQNQPNISSDIRYKSNVQDIDKYLLELVGKYIKPKQYETRFDDKLHFGYIAQDVEKALYSYSLKKYGWSEANEWLRRHAVLSKSESYIGLLYGEVAVIVDAYNRMKHEELENRILLLEGKGE